MTSHAWRTRFSWWMLRVHWILGVVFLAVYTQTSVISLLLVTAAWICGAWMDARETPRAMLSRLGAVIVGILLAIAAADLLFIRRDLMSSSSFLLIGIQSIRMLLPKDVRESWQLCALSLLEFLIAASIADEISFAFFAFLFFAVSIGAMWSLHDLGAEKSGRPISGYAPSVKTAAWAFFLISVGGFLMTAVLFAVVPRMEFRRMFLRFTPKNAISGFSDKITLSEITSIKSDHRVAARVEFPFLEKEPDPDKLYLRGAVYSQYSGGEWRLANSPTFVVPRMGFYYLPPAPPPGVATVADITLESASHSRMFIYGRPVRIETSFDPLMSDQEGNLFFAQEGHPVVRYRLLFVEEPPPRKRRVKNPGGLYLEFPAGYEDIRLLALDTVKNANTDEERAALLLDFFRHGFTYSLTNPASTLRSFIFDKKSGFCEHYAAGLALLLRAAGVPSRVAVGYYGGEWNLLGNYLIVRQSDAHAWVEAWIGGRWVTMDATPPQPKESFLQQKLGFLLLYADWLRHRWDKYVMNYSLRMQASAVRGGIFGLKRISRQISFSAPRQILPVAAAAILLLLLWRMRRRWRNNTPQKDRIPAHYARLLRRLEKYGYRISPGVPMAEMLEAAVKAQPDLAEEVGAFLSLYHRDRFDAKLLPPDLLAEAALRADRLKKQISR